MTAQNKVNLWDFLLVLLILVAVLCFLYGGTEMTFYEQMIPALSALLEKGETLQAPIYGTLFRKRNHDFAYFGLTDTALLIALLQGDSKNVYENSRISWCRIQRAKVRKSWIPFMYVIRIELTDGATIKIRAAKKVYGFATQEENLKAFLAKLQEYETKNKRGTYHE